MTDEATKPEASAPKPPSDGERKKSGLVAAHARLDAPAEQQGVRIIEAPPPIGSSRDLPILSARDHRTL